MLARYSYEASEETASNVSKIGFQLIFTYSIGMMILFTLILIDILLGSYTIFLYIAWSTAVLAAILGYLGFFLPEWLKKIIEK